ncbi:MAG: hypothetical protein M2R45_04317 [Verrucomicrobia subdivision 3 bacterium]|nr:hypothetical protein [Limisphaerales bacterium]MCS1417232.1 hypothetical protein [Limisphaerales bacterium]
MFGYVTRFSSNILRGFHQGGTRMLTHNGVYTIIALG